VEVSTEVEDDAAPARTDEVELFSDAASRLRCLGFVLRRHIRYHVIDLRSGFTVGTSDTIEGAVDLINDEEEEES
jgi:hypothetical protein